MGPEAVANFRSAFRASWAVSGLSARAIEAGVGVGRQAVHRMQTTGQRLPSIAAMVAVCRLLPDGEGQELALMAVAAKHAEWGLWVDVRGVGPLAPK
jgi:hypothetical protein